MGVKGEGMARDRYPDDVEVKDHNFSTTKREQAAKDLLEHWGTPLTDLPDKTGTASRGTYQDVRDEYLGPTSHPITFEEIRALPEVGTIGEWIDYRRKGMVDKDGRVNIEKREINGYDAGYDDGYDDGEEDGFMKGFMKCENLMMDALDNEEYMKVRRKMLEAGKGDVRRVENEE